MSILNRQHLTLYIIIGVTLLLFASCGQQHDAEVLVKDFMKQNMQEGLETHGRSFNDLDSTRHVSDSLVNSMRSRGSQAVRYRHDITYAEGAATVSLYVLRVKYMIDTLECSDTYYLDNLLTRVVAFKEN